ncbi:MAG: hypothetical protein Q8P53_00975 [Candidatus Shapirobacteria bacterium]|nr:hypothetical protein [Candidatus Shapirobacteria bacterium]
MLRTATDKRLGVGVSPSPPWSSAFSDFMKDIGLDGIVYNESGEGKNGSGGATFVFYNQEKIGTFDSWQGKKQDKI